MLCSHPPVRGALGVEVGEAAGEVVDQGAADGLHVLLCMYVCVDPFVKGIRDRFVL